MKPVICRILILALVFTSCGGRETKNPDSGSSLMNNVESLPMIAFDSLINDIGRINEGEQVVVWFDYTNTGKGPLIIHDIKAGCGCTVPGWKKDPVDPGESESIRVVFNASGKKGTQNIKISVFSNAVNAKEDLQLKAIVENFN
ncbi:MAG: DUF1573 domain-containing protein [Bacteroidales bacterium]